MMKRGIFFVFLMTAISPLVFSQAIGIFDGQVSIGDDNGQGSATFANGVYDVVGSGNDLWGSADGCYFVYKEVTGSFLITGEVNWEKGGPRDGDEWKKAGFMARDSVGFEDDPGSPHATGIIIRSQGSNLEKRTDYTGRSDDIAVQEKRADETNVIQLMRVGDTFTMLRQVTDGTFRVIGSIDIPMPTTILVGLVVTSHNTSTTERAFFSGVTLQLLGVPVIVTRTIPQYKVEAGGSVTGISLGLSVETGKTTDATVTEKVPAGFTVSNVKASVGTTSVSGDGVITWTVPGATGADAKLTYDISAPISAVGVLAFSGNAKSGSDIYSGGGDWQLTAVPPKSNGYGVFTTSEDLYESETAEGDAGYDPNTGTYVVIGAGNDIWGSADNFHYLYREVSGKVSLKADCLLYEGDGHTEWAKIGPMVRDDADSWSAHGMSMIRTWGRDFGPQWRDIYAGTSGNNESLNVPGGTAAGQQTGTVEITRDGTKIGFYYYDAASGQRVETLVHDVGDMVDPIYVGFAVTSHRAGYYSTGVFKNVVLAIDGKTVPIDEWSLY
ncbi:MAG: hypothetical protein AB1656_12135 [Candidatus Omnitrophota bacterium]